MRGGGTSSSLDLMLSEFFWDVGMVLREDSVQDGTDLGRLKRPDRVTGRV